MPTHSESEEDTAARAKAEEDKVTCSFRPITDTLAGTLQPT